MSHLPKGRLDLFLRESFQEHFLGTVVLGILPLRAVVELDFVDFACVGGSVP